MKNVVLVHGGFVDGAGWEGVYKILKKNGYNVSIVQNPTISLEDDVAVTKRALRALDGESILVGHSYGGAVITEAGNSGAPCVYHGLRPGQRRVGGYAHPKPSARCAGSTDSAPAGRPSVPGPDEIRGLIRS